MEKHCSKVRPDNIYILTDAQDGSWSLCRPSMPTGKTSFTPEGPVLNLMELLF